MLFILPDASKKGSIWQNISLKATSILSGAYNAPGYIKGTWMRFLQHYLAAAVDVEAAAGGLIDLAAVGGVPFGARGFRLIAGDGVDGGLVADEGLETAGGGAPTTGVVVD